jgi:RNA polymerase sigma factor (TIGR02999 family)
MCDVTHILGKIEAGDPSAAEGLLPLVYEELRKLAAAKMAQERPDQTLQATALVHEAYIRLVDVDKAQHWDSRGHFFAAAAESMRRILIDRARDRKHPSTVLNRKSPGTQIGRRLKDPTKVPARSRLAKGAWASCTWRRSKSPSAARWP